MGKKSKKGLGAAKTAAKTEKKATQKLKKELKSKGEEDIEQILAEFQEKDKNDQRITEECAPPPSLRSSFSFTAHPDKDELLLFGGEYCNGQKTFLYNDLYVYRLKKKDWILLKSPGAPPPRCSHQAVALSQRGGQLWIFGGEFASPTQSQFHHYKDLWVLSLQEKIWKKITASGGPSARSGHRMVAVKQQLIVFGGFHDNGRTYKYFNDVHAFNLDTYKWTKLEVKGQAPSPRSGCQMMAISEGRVLIYGGYSKEGLKNGVDKGIVHSDMFTLSPEKGDASGTKWRWSQVKTSGHKPSPRCSCTMVGLPNGSKGYMFGGVHDEESEETLEGTFYNDLYQLDADNRKWYLVNLRGKRTDAAEKPQRRAVKRKVTEEEGQEERNEEEEAESDIDKAVKELDLDEEEKVDNENVEDMDVKQENSEDGIFTLKIGPQKHDGSAGDECATAEGDVKQFVPRPRMFAGLAIKHGVLYLYGGVFEAGDKMVVMADMHALDLHKLDCWQTLIEYDDQDQEWLETDSSGDDDDDEDDEDEDENDDDEENEEEQEGKEIKEDRLNELKDDEVSADQE